MILPDLNVGQSSHWQQLTDIKFSLCSSWLLSHLFQLVKCGYPLLFLVSTFRFRGCLIPYLRVISCSTLCWSSSLVSLDSWMRNSSTSWMVRRLLAAGGQDLLCSKKRRIVSETSPCLQEENKAVGQSSAQQVGKLSLEIQHDSSKHRNNAAIAWRNCSQTSQ